MALYVVESDDAALQRAAEIFAAQISQAIRERKAAPAIELQAALGLTSQRGSALSEEEFSKLYPRAASAGLFQQYQASANELLRQKANAERAWLVAMANASAGQVSETGQRAFQQASTAIGSLLANQQLKLAMQENLERARKELAGVQLQLANNRTVNAGQFAELLSRFVVSSDQNVTELARAMLGMLGVQNPTAADMAEAASSALGAFRSMASLLTTMKREGEDITEGLAPVVTKTVVDLATNSGIGLSVDAGAQLLEKNPDPGVASAVNRNWVMNMVRSAAQGQEEQALQYWLAARLATEHLTANKDVEVKPREVKELAKSVSSYMASPPPAEQPKSEKKESLFGYVAHPEKLLGLAKSVASYLRNPKTGVSEQVKQYAEEFRQDLAQVKAQLQQQPAMQGGEFRPQQILGNLGFQQIAPALVPKLSEAMKRQQAAAEQFGAQALTTAQEGLKQAEQQDEQMRQEFQHLADAIGALDVLKQNVHSTTLVGPGGEKFPLQYSTVTPMPFWQMVQQQKPQPSLQDVLDFLTRGGERWNGR